MNIKVVFSLLLAVTVSASTVNAGPHRNGGNRNISRSNRTNVTRSFSGGGGRTTNWSGQRFAANRSWNTTRHWTGQNWNGKRWSGQRWNSNHYSNWNWHHHHHHHNNFVFLDFGFPFWGWSTYPYYYDYPYDYGYYPYGSYGNGYYGSYNYDYGNSYGYDNGSGNAYSGGYDGKVAELQRRLSSAGYYRGEIDGIFGPRTQYALKAYRHDHPNGEESGNYNQRNYPTLRNRPYSPPPTTTEPDESE